jgi:L-lactate dehydrogenase complex protein LldE
MDAFEPELGIATLELLERFGCEVEYPIDRLVAASP